MRFARGQILLLILALTGVLGFTCASRGQGIHPQLPEAYRNVGVTEHAGAQLPLNLQFFDEHADRVTLGQLLHGRPLVLQLGYLNCPMLCDVLAKSFVDASRDLSFTAGKDFDYAFISIDPSDSPDIAAAKRSAYLQEYGRADVKDGFHVLVGRPNDIRVLADAVGFRYARVPEAGQFAHPAVLFVLTADGHISRYLYGAAFTPHSTETLKRALIEAGQGQIGSTIDRLIELCLHYDASTGKYTLAVVNIMRLGGILTVLTLACTISYLNISRRGHGLDDSSAAPGDPSGGTKL